MLGKEESKRLCIHRMLWPAEVNERERERSGGGRKEIGRGRKSGHAATNELMEVCHEFKDLRIKWADRTCTAYSLPVKD
jgi:hypothetical protein